MCRKAAKVDNAVRLLSLFAARYLLAAHREHWTSRLGHNVLRGSVRQVCDCAHSRVSRPHAKDDQVSDAVPGNVDDALGCSSELMTKLDYAHRAAPRFGFAWNQLLEAQRNRRFNFVNVRYACGRLLDDVKQSEFGLFLLGERECIRQRR